MKVFIPNRNRVALDVNSINDPDLRQALTKLAGLQQETRNLNNGLSPKIQMVEQEIANTLSQMKQADQQLTDVLNTIKTQISSLTDAAVRYVQMGESSIDEEPKFRKSFVYMVEDAVGRLDQVLGALKEKAGGLLTNAPAVPAGTAGGFTSPTESVQEVVSPPVAPEPANLVTSSIRNRIAVALKQFLENIKQIQPILEQATASIQKNEEVMKEINEVMGAVSEVATPEPENTELFSPEEEAAPAEPGDEFAPPEEEVGEATSIEETGDLGEEEVPEEEVPVVEEAPEEEPTPEDEVPEEAEEDSADLETEGEAPVEEAEAETGETEEPVAAEEEIIEEEPVE